MRKNIALRNGEVQDSFLLLEEPEVDVGCLGGVPPFRHGELREGTKILGRYFGVLNSSNQSYVCFFVRESPSGNPDERRTELVCVKENFIGDVYEHTRRIAREIEGAVNKVLLPEIKEGDLVHFLDYTTADDPPRAKGGKINLLWAS